MSNLGGIMEKIIFLDIDGVLNDNNLDFLPSCLKAVKN